MFDSLRTLIVALIAVVTCKGAEPTFSVKSVPIGSSQIDIVQHDFGGDSILFCNLHDDEDTSVDAAMKVLHGRDGKLIQLRHTGERLVNFQLNDQEFKFDPNRIFTEKGVRRTLEDQSTWSQEAHDVVAKFGRELIALYGLEPARQKHKRSVIALHNNSEARYAASSYLPGQSLANEASKVVIQPGSDPDDFFFVTDDRLYAALSARNFNVVLQNNDAVTDDGSLSVYCGHNGNPYVNVEAQHGHLKSQIAMIEGLLEAMVELELIDVADSDRQTSQD